MDNPKKDRSIESTMEIERNHAEKPLLKLRRTLKRLPTEPSSREVHALRTDARRLEAVVDALNLDQKRKTRRLLKSVRPVRKAAGEVRDMDVLVGNLLAISHGDGDDSLVRLIEHLGEMRTESAKQLRDTVERKRKDALRSLKQYAKLVGKIFNQGSPAMTSTSPAAQQIATELARWPELTEENIHPFRIRVKQLRYMLQLSERADQGVVDALGKVKDQVGDWHDWHELAKIAREVLDAKKDQAALKRIDVIGSRKFDKAMATANEVRKRYFGDLKMPGKSTQKDAKAYRRSGAGR